MSKLVWDAIGERTYETGTKEGALYVVGDDGAYGAGVAWDGLISVSETPSGAESTSLYANDGKYLDLTSAEEFGGTITAYQSPEEFDACDGNKEIAPGVLISQQDRKSFGFAFKTTLGNDTNGNNYGYVLHLIYGAKASVSERSYTSINESPEAMELSWDFTTTPVQVAGSKPTSIIRINSVKANAEKLAALEKILYGDESAEPRLPLPEEVATLMSTTNG